MSSGGLIALEGSPSTTSESRLRLTSRGFQEALADSCRDVIGFPVPAVGTAVPFEFASGVDPTLTSVVDPV